jgi:cytoskeletal protein CcmA (bactofilin family)
MFRKVIGQKPADADSNAGPVSEPEEPAAQVPETTSPAPSAPSRPSSSGHQSASRNVLSSDVEIKGTVKFTNDLVVDGKIEGEISSEGNLTVGENARLKAEIRTATVVVYGKVHGNIIASERVDLKASAEVVGDIQAKTLSIESGAIFVGKSVVGTPSTPAAQGKTDSKPQGQTGGGSAKPGNKPQQPQQQNKSGDGNKPEQGSLAGIKS